MDIIIYSKDIYVVKISVKYKWSSDNFSVTHTDH